MVWMLALAGLFSCWVAFVWWLVMLPIRAGARQDDKKPK